MPRQAQARLNTGMIQAGTFFFAAAAAQGRPSDLTGSLASRAAGPRVQAGNLNLTWKFTLTARFVSE